MSFEHSDTIRANSECRHRDAFVKDYCGKCKMPVMLHCSECKLQVSGCLCTEVERFGQDEAWRRAIDQMGEELAREKYRRAGFYVPEVRNN